jgi:hypothetical protein
MILTNPKNSRLSFTTLLLLSSIGTVFAHSSSNYNMSKNVLSNGGKPASSSNYQLLSTIGQFATRRGTTNNTVLSAGFHHPSKRGISPATCQLYAVNDKGLNNSQFFTITLDNHEVSKLGPLYQKHDIEALAVHPQTNLIYAASSDNVAKGNSKGHLYLVDGENGQLFPMDNTTGFNEIEDLAFSADGTLWAWAKGDGLLTIDRATGVGHLEIPSNILVEGLTLSKDKGTVFYGTVNTDLWVYDMDASSLEVTCPNLFGETEALEMMADGLLLTGTHKDKTLSLHAFDPNTCQVVVGADISTNPFDDVEGIALPLKACAK